MSKKLITHLLHKDATDLWGNFAQGVGLIGAHITTFQSGPRRCIWPATQH